MSVSFGLVECIHNHRTFGHCLGDIFSDGLNKKIDKQVTQKCEQPKMVKELLTNIIIKLEKLPQ